MKLTLNLGSVICLLLIFTGCASIVSGGVKTLPIMSDKEGVSCEITNIGKGNKLIAQAKTPYTAVLDRHAGYFSPAKYNVKFTKEGYLPYNRIIEASVNPWYFGNILFGGLIGFFIVDPLTGAMWSIKEDDITASLYPDSPDGRRCMAVKICDGATTTLKEANYDQAIIDSEKALAYCPDYVEAYCVQAAAYKGQGKTDKSIEVLTKAIAINPNFANAYKDLGEIYFDMSKLEDAVANFNKAIELKADYSEAFYARGLVFRKQHKCDSAKADLQRACHLGHKEACNKTCD